MYAAVQAAFDCKYDALFSALDSLQHRMGSDWSLCGTSKVSTEEREEMSVVDNDDDVAMASAGSGAGTKSGTDAEAATAPQGTKTRLEVLMQKFAKRRSSSILHLTPLSVLP